MGVRETIKMELGRIRKGIDTSVPGTLGLKMEEIRLEGKCSVKSPAAASSCPK